MSKAACRRFSVWILEIFRIKNTANGLYDGMRGSVGIRIPEVTPLAKQKSIFVYFRCETAMPIQMDRAVPVAGVIYIYTIIKL